MMYLIALLRVSEKPAYTAMAELEDTIEEAAQGPKRVAGDELTVDQHGLKDLIEADRYLANKQAVKSTTRELLLTKMSPPGTT